MQGHLNMEWPGVEEFEKSLLAFSETGVKVMITELDLSILPNPRPNVGADVATSFEYRKEMNPYAGGLPEEVEAAWEKRFNDFFTLFLKHQDKISRVTLWGVSDANSWLNDWPIPGRTNYPLLFDRNYQLKFWVNGKR
jgi:endo-1,4-beta-xylanase